LVGFVTATHPVALPVAETFQSLFPKGQLALVPKPLVVHPDSVPVSKPPLVISSIGAANVAELAEKASIAAKVLSFMEIPGRLLVLKSV
jgi:hypothetical protein